MVNQMVLNCIGLIFRSINEIRDRSTESLKKEIDRTTNALDSQPSGRSSSSLTWSTDRPFIVPTTL